MYMYYAYETEIEVNEFILGENMAIGTYEYVKCIHMCTLMNNVLDD